ncbi:hypothetical protein T459_05790 [Capsicum annuum]|uniref:Uncharacterized protein n=1 Tax=Capsicum annuum TaxID=4072 RepID=A0A2G3A8X1_CAPAN|nr:hypothetical protein T459_05790 [Capsicum annuum]
MTHTSELKCCIRYVVLVLWNWNKGVATDVVDNNEGSGMDMVSFIARTMTISDDAEDFSDFEKHYHKMISSSWGIGGIIIPVVLLMSFFNYYYGARNMNRIDGYSVAPD